jgi:hypothetical protein
VVADQIADRAAGCPADKQADDEWVKRDPSAATHRDITNITTIATSTMAKPTSTTM